MWRIKNGGECEGLVGTCRKSSSVEKFHNPCENPVELGDPAKLHCEI